MVDLTTRQIFGCTMTIVEMVIMAVLLAASTTTLVTLFTQCKGKHGGKDISKEERTLTDKEAMA